LSSYVFLRKLAHLANRYDVLAEYHKRISFELAERAVHIRAVRLIAPDPVVARFASLLTPDERGRAGRFRFKHLRRSFTLARGALRILLGRYLNIDPAAIRFVYGEKGKPRLAEPSRIRFNASHSGDLALYAFTPDCEVGVDVEKFRPMTDLREIAARFFCAEEAAELMQVPEEQRGPAFFRCWTRKEAYIKAIGDGLSVPLDAFAVSLRAGDPAQIIHIGRDAAAAAAWTLENLEPAPDYAAAVAYRDAPRVLRVEPVVEPNGIIPPEG
jgi:4'-phosphopantetheinyl transferase